MQKEMNKPQDGTLYRLFYSFTPASRAVISLAIPFTIVDAIHYYTAGTALIFSFPILVLIYLYCGAKAARLAYVENQDIDSLAHIGRSAGLRLWLTSTVINTFIAVIMGFASLGFTLLGGAVHLCLFAPFHALASGLLGWLGAKLFQQYYKRTISN